MRTAFYLTLGLAAAGAAHAQSPPEALHVQPNGAAPAQPGPAANFTGQVKVEAPFRGRGSSRVNGATVTFQPGARTAWHTHPLGQTLVVTQGCGLAQSEGAAATTIRPGDVVWIPAGVRHWHGASARAAMSHVAIHEALDGKVVTWMEHVPEQTYSAGVQSSDCGDRDG